MIIVGGTGLLGYHASLELLKRGYELTALSLDDINLEGWYPEAIRVIHGDVFGMSGENLEGLMKGHYAMIYAMGPDDRSAPEAPAELFFREKLGSR